MRRIKESTMYMQAATWGSFLEKEGRGRFEKK